MQDTHPTFLGVLEISNAWMHVTFSSPLHGQGQGPNESVFAWSFRYFGLKDWFVREPSSLMAQLLPRIASTSCPGSILSEYHFHDNAFFRCVRRRAAAGIVEGEEVSDEDRERITRAFESISDNVLGSDGLPELTRSTRNIMEGIRRDNDQGAAAFPNFTP